MGEERGKGAIILGHADQASTGTYVLRSLVHDVPLPTEESTAKAQITCVEMHGDNLYIGTSQAEILHFVSIPADPSDESQSPQYIFASRLQPAYNTQSSDHLQVLPGVQRILVLSRVQKACILCNGTLSFYSLPELSPALGNTTVGNCTWVGGVDLDVIPAEEDGVVVMICVKNKTRLVKIRDEARRVRDIEFPGCLVSIRRRNFACVADAHSYALLDVENQQKISLFPISSLDDNSAGGKVETLSPTPDPATTHTSSSSRPVSSEGGADARGHGRSTSLGTFVGGLGRRQGSPQPRSQSRSGLAIPESTVRDTSPSPAPSHSRNVSTPDVPTQTPIAQDKPLPDPPPRSDSLRGQTPTLLKPQSSRLLPHMVSPTPSEFLLTTGTGNEEPGVGIFVNLDGDVVRGTLQFDRYPCSIVVDRLGNGGPTDDLANEHEGFVLAAMVESKNSTRHGVVEIQRWDARDGAEKERLPVPEGSSRDEPGEEQSLESFGIRTVDTTVEVPFGEVGAMLRSGRLRLPGQSASEDLQTLDASEKRRTQEEVEFGRRLGGRKSNIVLWSGSGVWWVVKNPLAMKLNTAINRVLAGVPKGEAFTQMERSSLIQIISSIRGGEASSETEFLSLEYIRQKISLVLFADLISRPSNLPPPQSADLRISEGLLMEGGIDPRVILSLIPVIREEVIEGQRGIWIHEGLLPVIDTFVSKTSRKFKDLVTADLLSIVKRYLSAWRQRKGFGSIPDETEVFLSVDAALLRVLLEQDYPEPARTSKPSPTRLELYALVDSGVECFDRAIDLLEKYKRLFVLSRLYQSRRLARKVLETWKRIIEGETDEGGGLNEGENEVRKYLVNIKDTGLVDEYGTWLARRNPALGVQVFTNENSRVKWEHQQAVMLLRRKAPDAVKVYLEHLVFGKKNSKYANDLISYYLDSVLTVLASSEEARSILSQSYESYRALHPPKPTYRQFIVENAVSSPWWHDRLRLLELIGGSHGSDFTYDVSKILSRIEPFEEELVPESIILDGRQGRHKQAIRLLTHGLGDFHTAVNYCLLGGASIFHPSSGSAAAIAAPSQEEQAVLFGYLLTEFLRIEDINDRLERTSELLERFSSWYDIRDVLDLIPESWSVDLISGFLISSFRRIVSERNDAMITKALSGAENLQVASAFVEKCSAAGPKIVAAP